MFSDEEGKFVDENGRELTFSEMLAEADREQSNRLANDSEWSTPITIHINSVIAAFALGVLQSYPHYHNFQMPPNYELVMNRMSILLQKEFEYQIRGTECVQVSLLKLKGVYRRLAMTIQEYKDWNQIGDFDQDQFVSLYDSVPSTPSFIDLDVPPHNAVIYLRDRERDHKRFDEEFKKEYGDLD